MAHERVVDRSADRGSGGDCAGVGGLSQHTGAFVMPSAAESLEPADAAMQSLVREMIEVHGAGAAAIARENARRAAVAAQLPQAKRWLKVLDQIQQQYRLRETSQRAGRSRPQLYPEHKGA